MAFPTSPSYSPSSPKENPKPSILIWYTYRGVYRAAIDETGCIAFKKAEEWKNSVLAYKFSETHIYSSESAELIGRGSYANVYKITMHDILDPNKNMPVAIRITREKEDFKSFFNMHALLEVLLYRKKIMPFFPLLDAFATETFPLDPNWPVAAQKQKISSTGLRSSAKSINIEVPNKFIYATVSTLASKGSLNREIEKGQTEWDLKTEKLPAIFQLLQQLNAFRRIGIVHRDIKLDNILVHQTDETNLFQINLLDVGAKTSRGLYFPKPPETTKEFLLKTQQTLQISDFGLSQQYLMKSGETFQLNKKCASQDEDDSSEMRGTPVYMAPEVVLLQGSKLFDINVKKTNEELNYVFGSDVFSLGQIACNILAWNSHPSFDELVINLRTHVPEITIKFWDDIWRMIRKNSPYSFDNDFFSTLALQGVLYGAPYEGELKTLHLNYSYPRSILVQELLAPATLFRAFSDERNVGMFYKIKDEFYEYGKKLTALLKERQVSTVTEDIIETLRLSFPWARENHAKNETEILELLSDIEFMFSSQEKSINFLLTAKSDASSIHETIASKSTFDAYANKVFVMKQKFDSFILLFQDFMLQWLSQRVVKENEAGLGDDPDVPQERKPQKQKKQKPTIVNEALPIIIQLNSYYKKLQLFETRLSKENYFQTKSALIAGLSNFFLEYVSWMDSVKQAVDPKNRGIYLEYINRKLKAEGVEDIILLDIGVLLHSMLNWNFEQRHTAEKLLFLPIFDLFRVNNSTFTQLAEKTHPSWIQGTPRLVGTKKRRDTGKEKEVVGSARGRKIQRMGGAESQLVSSDMASNLSSSCSSVCVLPGCDKTAVFRCSVYQNRNFCSSSCASLYWSLYSNKTSIHS